MIDEKFIDDRSITVGVTDPNSCAEAKYRLARFFYLNEYPYFRNNCDDNFCFAMLGQIVILFRPNMPELFLAVFAQIPQFLKNNWGEGAAAPLTPTPRTLVTFTTDHIRW